jgi:DNA-directed RNA polymerase subunit RPC12/RpoP
MHSDNHTGLEQSLEDPSRVPFYDLLGGLADDLLTLSSYGGSFLECAACGHTFTMKGRSWSCERCGSIWELKFKPVRGKDSGHTESEVPGLSPTFKTVAVAKAKGVKEKVKATVCVNGLIKPSCGPHWYFHSENWSVAEFLTQILRLQPEYFLPGWCRQLGVDIHESAALETALCWPRFKFGSTGSVIQPDIAIGFSHDLVFVEFKRPHGAQFAPGEVLGQLSFAAEAGAQLKRDYHLFLIPGPDGKAKAPADYLKEALADKSVSKVRAKWGPSAETLDRVIKAPIQQLAPRVTVLGWETLLTRTAECIRATVPESWSKAQALQKLKYFHDERAGRKLLAQRKWS